MGRLFWKFFFFFWLAQLTAGLGVGLTFWLKDRAHEGVPPGVDLSPPAVFDVNAAAATLRHGGVAALRALLDEQRRMPGPPVFVLDDAGRELFDRPIAPETRARVVRSAGAAPADAPHGPAPRGVARVAAADGRVYVLFVPPPVPHGAPASPSFAPPSHPGDGGEPGGARPPPRSPLPFPPIQLLAGALVSLLFAVLLAWYFAKPIGRLRAAFAAAADGRLEQRLAPEMGGRRDELADLGRDFDRMAARLKSLMDGQQRLLHDVSHELRSPLARLQAAIGLLRQQPERGADLLARIERESVRMDRLVSELLALSRLEVGVAGRLEEAVDLRELLDALVEDARFEAQAGARRVDYAAPEATTPLAIRGDAELLHRALENVVRNALKHSPAGGRVSVALAREAGGAGYRIRVADDGPGVPEAELQAIFAPFYRAAAGSPADGYGLGLAITQRVVALHGGRIEAANRPGGGLCVNIFLPRRESAPTLA